MKFSKSHFRYTKNQRNGIFSFLLIIATIQFTYVFYKVDLGSVKTLSIDEQIAFQKEYDSLIQLRELEKKPSIYPFNPNFISDYKGYQLGMSIEEIDRLHEFRATEKFINSAEEFQKVTKISDSLLDSIKEYFKFPNFSSSTNKFNPWPKKSVSIPEKKSDLNRANPSDFETLPGIGKTLASRIVNYRNKLQGYTFNNQLKEVWNLDSVKINMILDHFEILNPPIIEKLDINKATFKELLAVVYIDYELTKKIVQYRLEVAEIQSLEELKKIDGFPVEKFDRIALYLGAK